MRKQLWIMVKQFLLYLLLDNMAMVVVMAPSVIDAIMKGYRGKDVLEYADPSMSTTLWTIIVGYIITIGIFLKMRYVRLSTGHIAHSNYWKAAGYAMLIAWAWVITNIGCLLLVNLFFPEATVDDSMNTDEMQYPLLMFIAGCVLAPISEEIAFRGILVGGLLRMRQKPWVAIVCPALIFALYHGDYSLLVGCTVFGIICGWLYWRTKSLLPGILIHIINNSTAFFLMLFGNNLDVDGNDLDVEPNAYFLLLLIAIFLSLLVLGLRWYKREFARGLLKKEL